MAGAKPKRPKARTLKALRNDAPVQDRSLPALAPPPPMDATAAPSAKYLPTYYRATTLDHLRTSCGRYAEAAVNEAQASAVRVWMMKEGGRLDHGIPTEVIIASLVRCDASRRIADGYPSIAGCPPTPTLADFSPDAAEEARRVNADVLALWAAAGSPHLANAVQNVRQTIAAVFRQQTPSNKGNAE